MASKLIHTFLWFDLIVTFELFFLIIIYRQNPSPALSEVICPFILEGKFILKSHKKILYWYAAHFLCFLQTWNYYLTYCFKTSIIVGLIASNYLNLSSDLDGSKHREAHFSDMSQTPFNISLKSILVMEPVSRIMSFFPQMGQNLPLNKTT